MSELPRLRSNQELLIVVVLGSPIDVSLMMQAPPDVVAIVPQSDMVQS